MLRILLLLSLFTLLNESAFGQLWQQIPQNSIDIISERDIIPNKYKLYKIDDAAIKRVVLSAPYEDEAPILESNVWLHVPDSKGQMDAYQIVAYRLIEEPLASKYAQFRACYGFAKDNKNKRVRIDYTAQGFRAVITDNYNKTYIDHFQRGDLQHRIIYTKADITNEEPFTCHVKDEDGRGVHDDHRPSQNRQGDCLFRTYRLAMATTGEYSTFHGGTEPLVLSAVMTSMNRVNEVYEADVSGRMVLIGNTNLIFYYNANTDPYTNSNGGTMLGENQTNIDNIIGNLNYDIGHVFSTGGGGIASLNSLCNNANKARGVTGRGAPVGDPFDIDYVAHEIGHQFGGPHTFNNSCGGNISPNNAFEPGSGSTIMAYAGICSPNIQNNSDAYFHANSIQRMKARMDGTTCAVTTVYNSPPTLAVLTNATVPLNTVIELTAVASDPNADPLTYCWEQMDNASATMPPVSTNSGGPAFRSLLPVSSPIRSLPSYPNVINGTSNTWEVLPSVARTMNWRATVRDFHIGSTVAGGCTAERDMVLTFAANTGPFNITSQNTATTVLEGQPMTITWNVGNTNVAPINCSNVEILMSYDGGVTFPTTLLASTPNTGNANVVIPAGLTTQGRIKVKAIGNVFYDINGANITVQVGSPSFVLSYLNAEQSVCNNQSATVSVAAQSILGFTGSINLSISGLPSGTNAVISPNPLIAAGTANITLSNFGINQGAYPLTVTGTSGSITRMVTQNLFVTAPAPAPSLVSPANNAVDVAIPTILSWNTIPGATLYQVQVSESSTFSTLEVDSILSNIQVTLTDLEASATLFWRVRASSNCENTWSSTRVFTTEACNLYMSSNIPVTIPTTVSTVFSNLNITDIGVIQDIDVIDLEGTHTWVDDLRFTLIGPNNNEIIFWNQPCNSENNFDINFDDGAANSNWPCPPVDGLTYQPDNPLAGFHGDSIQGLWRLKVEDLVNQDGGSLNKWGLRVCGISNCPLLVTSSNISGPNSLISAIECAAPGDTIRISSTVSEIDMSGNNFSFDKNLFIMYEGSGTVKIKANLADKPMIGVLAGVNIGLKGITVECIEAISPLILNEGSIILDNTTVNKIGGSATTVIHNKEGATLEVRGSTSTN